MNESPRVILLDMGSEAGAVESILREAGYLTVATAEPRTALEQCSYGPSSVILLSSERLSEVRSLVLQARPWGRGTPPLVALCPSATVAALEEARAIADAVLPWPEGAPRLTRVIEALATRASAKLELGFRRASARVLQEITAILGTDDELEFLIGDVLTRIVEATEAVRAFLVVLRPDQSLYFVAADTEESSGITVPVPKDELPEVTECASTQQELFVRAGPGDPLEEAALGRGVGALLLEPLISLGRVFAVLELELELESGIRLGPAAIREGAGPPHALLDLVREAAALLGNALYGSEYHVKIGEQTKITAAKIQGGGGGGGGGGERSEVLKKYKEFFQRAFDGFVVLDPSLRIIHINPAGEQITGYARQGLIGQELGQFVLESDRPHLEAMIREMSAGGSVKSFDLGLVTPSGEPVLVSASPSAVLADEKALVLSFRDVTEARALENQLRSTKEFLERLVGSAVDAIVATNTQGFIILFNKGAERIFGLGAETVLGRITFTDLFPPGEASKILEQIRGPGFGGSGRLEAARTEAVGSSREPIPVSLSANLLYEDGVEVGLVAILSDLRERLLMEQRLVQVQEKLVETEKQALIAELAGTAAHELNQPLTSVMGYAELLKRRIPEDDSNHRAAEVIIREAERMAEIVRKIGRITKYEVKPYVGSTNILDLEKSSE
jgi:PAS domain S-box-containing protein